MTELNFKGKEFVYNHHLAVPFRPLVPQPEKGIGPVALDGNLIVQGDNLHALKALLPMYAGKVDCIFIDPPYNTGNEGWAYNDNVNAPMIKEWLEGNPIGIEDGLRHDKWCAMMWPRLRLLHELLAETGSFWMTLDDNEVHNARQILDEVFGKHNFVATVIWQKVFSPKNTAKHFSEDHDYIIVYAKHASSWTPNLFARTAEMEGRYSNPDSDPNGPWTSGDLTARNPYSKGKYEVVGPTGKTFNSGSRYWRQSKDSFLEMNKANRIWWGVDGSNMPRMKRYLSEVKDGLVPQTLWEFNVAGHTQEAKQELLRVMGYTGDEDIFVTPKPTKLLSRILAAATQKNSIILDSFAGSGTTAHAVLEANKRDGGNRKFILVEMEDYADKLTAERVRRVINGYDFTGTHKTELLREKLNWSKLQKADKLTDQVEKIENLHGHEYDKISKAIKDGELIVTGEKAVKDKAAGLGGAFTYCTLGAPVDLDNILTGKDLPSYEALGAVLFHMATSAPLDPAQVDASRQYLGALEGQHLWLIYRPDLDWLKSPEAALTLSFARQIAEATPDARHLVFAPARHVSQKMLNDLNLPVEFVPLPFALYRIERE
ncbi:site-specific DNA-methyltransferase [Abyssibius alkaniclasticus]|uniref:site-specific DNA-methyltransferase n=1 Tax=Abyssibius alkaniclasticus TaxID=2881234 RepID=UPI00405934A1